MMIHKHLLTHDGVLGAKAGKILDLGFNGDFDIKNHRWNMLFAHVKPDANATDITVTAYKIQPTDWAKDAYDAGDNVFYRGCIWTAKGSVASTVGAPDSEDGSVLWRLATPSEIAAIAKTSIGSFVIGSAMAKNGGAFGIPMPRGLGRYFTLAVTGADTKEVTAGITDLVDTDITPGLDWTYYKAYTHKVNQPGPIEYAAADMFNGQKEPYYGGDPDVD